LKIRIQKIIADSGLCARRKAEQLIIQGRVLCNGRLVKLGDKADPDKDRIVVDKKHIVYNRKEFKRYLMLYKPRGYFTTMSDERGRRCVKDLIHLPERVYPIGRLDVNSEGLLLLTNDGKFAHQIMHPSVKVMKTYRVTIRPDITDMQAAELSVGIMIEGRKTAPAQVEILHKEPGRVVLEMKIHEGRNRQIRKMIESIGLEVARLKRTQIGPLRLGMLKPGTYRELTKEEINSLKHAISNIEKFNKK